MKKAAASAWSPRPAAAAPCGPVTRMSPSAPTPNRRSHSADTRAAGGRTRSSMSTSITKSFPVPWYLAKFSSDMDVGPFLRIACHRRRSQIPGQLVHDTDRPALAGLEPPDPRVSPEPRHLPAGQSPGPPDRGLDGLLQGELAGQVAGHLGVPDGLPGGRRKGWVPVDKRPDFVQEPGLDHGPDP